NFSCMTAVCERESGAGASPSFWFLQSSFSSRSFMEGLLLHQDRQLLFGAVQGHTHVIYAQSQRIRDLFIAEILEEEDDERLLHGVELGDGVVQAGETIVLRFV